MDNTKPYTKAPKPEIGRGCTFYYAPEGVAAKPCEGCYKLHETAWLEQYPPHTPTDIFEVRFKNTRRSYYQNVNNLPLERGDIVAVEASPGHDIGIVSLTGDMVARQMRRVGFNPYNGEFKKIYRKAKPYDIERWQEAIALEHETMITARQIAAEMGLNMKIGDVEYQGDKIKAIFYYIADERVDFRELIKVFAERFHIRIEMKQIGARQEAGRIGGIGACGRELCCASWISNFSSVTTNSARMQEISLNPQKLAGQCSKLKCCLAYEYDTYVDARKEFPRLREPLQALDGEYYLVKTDILAGTMSFSSSKDTMTNVVTLPVARVKEIIALNRAGKKVDQLSAEQPQREKFEEPTYRSEEGSITRFDGNGSKRKGRNRRRGDRAEERENRNNNGARNESAAEASAVSESRKDEKQENAANRSERREKRDRRERNNRNGQGEGRESRGERNNGQGEPHNPRNSDRNGPRNGQSTQKNEQRTERGNTSGEQNGERGNGQGSRSEQRGERRSERSRSENRPGQNGSETDPTPTHSQSPGEEGQNGARRRPRGRGGRNRREGNRREGGNGETAQPEPPKKEQKRLVMYLRSIIAIAGMLVTSCLSPHQTVVTDTGGGTWSESAEIEIPNADTVTPRDLYIVVRYNDSFRDDTLRLTIRTISPDSLVFEESYTLGLPPRRHPAALAEEASVPYRRHVIFPDSGIYRMAFTPAMPVRGVEAIGINQQKSE